MAKKKKTKLNNKAKLLIVIVLFIILIFSYVPVTSKIMIRLKGYSRHSVTMIYNKDLTKEITERDYSEFIDKTVSSDDFKIDYLEKYYMIKYVDKDSLLKEVNSLIEEEYNIDQINMIEEVSNDYLTNYLIDNQVKDIEKYIKVSIFKPERIERYLNNKQDKYEDTVLYVNMDRDKDKYEDPNLIKEYNKEMLVNVHNRLDEEYKPTLVELDKCSKEEHYLTKEAKEAYDKLCDAITKDGLNLSVNSSYRSYKDQEEIYETYLNLYGKNYVNKYVAVPGYSEHQTGLALDVMSLSGNVFKLTDEYLWMKENAHKYGFILRYDEGKEDITGYNSESWHYRYVGEKIAKEVYEKGFTYDEYYALYLDK